MPRTRSEAHGTANQPRDCILLSSAMMVSEEKRVPTNTHVLIVHGQGRQRRGQVGLGFPWHGMETTRTASVAGSRPTLPSHSAISQWPPTAWNFSHDHEQGDLVSIVPPLAAQHSNAGGKNGKLNVAGPWRHVGA